MLDQIKTVNHSLLLLFFGGSCKSYCKTIHSPNSGWVWLLLEPHVHCCYTACRGIKSLTGLLCLVMVAKPWLPLQLALRQAPPHKQQVAIAFLINANYIHCMQHTLLFWNACNFNLSLLDAVNNQKAKLLSAVILASLAQPQSKKNLCCGGGMTLVTQIPIRGVMAHRVSLHSVYGTPTTPLPSG